MTVQDVGMMTWEQPECRGLILEKGNPEDVRGRTGTHSALWFCHSCSQENAPLAAKSCNWFWVTQTPQRMVPLLIPNHQGNDGFCLQWPRWMVGDLLQAWARVQEWYQLQIEVRDMDWWWWRGLVAGEASRQIASDDCISMQRIWHQHSCWWVDWLEGSGWELGSGVRRDHTWPEFHVVAETSTIM